MKPFTVYLPDELYENLRRAAFEQKQSMSGLTVEALGKYLEEESAMAQRSPQVLTFWTREMAQEHIETLSEDWRGIAEPSPVITPENRWVYGIWARGFGFLHKNGQFRFAE